MILFNGWLASALKKYANLTEPRLLVTSLTQQELFTVEGERFYSFYDETFAAGETKYIQFFNPSDSGVAVGLQNRTFKSFNEAADLKILWDYTITGGVGASISVFNENNGFRSVGGSVETGNKLLVNLVPNANVTNEGIIREPDFLTASGAGSNSSGGVSADVGFRLYVPDTGFITKITNLDTNNANRILIAYSWIEVDLASLS